VPKVRAEFGERLQQRGLAFGLMERPGEQRSAGQRADVTWVVDLRYPVQVRIWRPQAEIQPERRRDVFVPDVLQRPPGHPSDHGVEEEARCYLLTVDAVAEGPGEHNPSLHNMVRAGIPVRYERPNWRWQAPAA
jgi:hypothetical protein